MKNSRTSRMRLLRHGGIYGSDVILLLASLSRSAAFRSGPGQAIRTRRKETRPTHRRDEFRPAIPRRVARQQSPSPLHRHHQLKSIAASSGIIYHRTVNSLLTVCLTHRDNPTGSIAIDSKSFVSIASQPHMAYRDGWRLTLRLQISESALVVSHVGRFASRARRRTRARPDDTIGVSLRPIF